MFFLILISRERIRPPSSADLSQEIAIKALHDYLRQRGADKPNLDKLMKYAKSLRVDMHTSSWH